MTRTVTKVNNPQICFFLLALIENVLSIAQAKLPPKKKSLTDLFAQDEPQQQSQQPQQQQPQQQSQQQQPQQQQSQQSQQQQLQLK